MTHKPVPAKAKILEQAVEHVVYSMDDIAATAYQTRWDESEAFHVFSEEPAFSLYHVLEDRIQRRFQPRMPVMEPEEDLPVNVLNDVLARQKPSRNILRDQSGVSAMEFGIALPVLALLLIGGIEYTRYILVHQKLDKSTNTTADLITRTSPINTQNLGQFADAMDGLMSPYEFRDSDIVIFTGVNRNDANPPQPPGQPIIKWQYSKPAGAIGRSRVGNSIGGVAIMPGNMPLNNRETTVIAESFYQFEPLLGDNFFTNTFFPAELRSLYKVAVYRPRLGEATECDNCNPNPQPAPQPTPQQVCPEPTPECLDPRRLRFVQATGCFICVCPFPYQVYNEATNTCDCSSPYIPNPQGLGCINPNPNPEPTPQPTPEPEPQPAPERL